VRGDWRGRTSAAVAGGPSSTGRRAVAVLLVALVGAGVLVPMIAIGDAGGMNEGGAGARFGKPDFGFSVTAASGVDTPTNYEYGTIQITLSEDEPIEGMTVIINTTIFNTGTTEGTVDVWFYDGPMSGKDLIGRDTITVKALRYGVANSTWNTTKEVEFHTLFVILDLNNTVDENNEDNNNATKNVTIDLVPAVGLGRGDGPANSPVQEDSAVLLKANVSDTQSDINTGFMFNWSFSDPYWNSTNPSELSEKNASSISHVFTHRGTYNISLLVTDDGGAFAPANLTVRVENAVPKASFTVERSSELEDTTVSFNASPSYDTPTDRAALMYRWDLGDGNLTNFTSSPVAQNRYPSKGTYKVKLTVRDDDGAEANTTSSINVLNRQPDVSAGADIEVDEDEEFILTATANDTPTDMASLTFRWTLAGKEQCTNSSLTASFPKKGVYELTAEVTDADGALGRDTVKVTVRNVAPTVEALAEPMGNGSEVLFRAFASDTPSDMRSLEYSWDFGDGASGAGAEIVHRYLTVGTYKAALTVQDDDGEGGTDSVSVTVRNHSPSVVLTGPRSLAEDEEGLFTATVSNPEGSVASMHWDFGDGASSEGEQANHSYPRSGRFNITFMATNDRGASGTATFQVTVSNVFPVARANWSRIAEKGKALVFDATPSSDTPSDIPGLDYLWSFGDGSKASGRIVEHVYNDAGEYSATLTVTDGELASATVKLLVTILERVGDTLQGMLTITIWVQPSTIRPKGLLTVSGEVALELTGGLTEVLKARAVRVSLESDSAGWTFSDTAELDRDGRFESVISAPRAGGKFVLRATVGLGELEASDDASFSVSKPAERSTFATVPVTIAAVAVFGLATAGTVIGGTDLGRFKFFALLAPLYTRLKKDSVLDHFDRGRIFEYIGKNPGAHYSEIHINLDLNNGALAYHLKVLEREGYIGSRSFGMYKRFFPSGYRIPEDDFVSIQELLGKLVTERPGIGQRDMASELGVARSTVNYHCNLLVSAGRIEHRKMGPKKSYWPR